MHNKNTTRCALRDLYNRNAKLQYWINKISTDLDGTDRRDLLKLIEHMQDRERASLWIIRCITALITIRRQLGKTFRSTTKDDLRQFLKWMEQKNYKASTNEKFRQILKLFYKVVYGNGDSYPDQVKFFSTRVRKELYTAPKYLDTREYLEEEQVIKLIDSAPTLQKKAFLACMYESGARPEEYLRISNTDFLIDTDGVQLILRGKTGERRVRIVTYAGLFQQWLDIHPLKDKSDFSIWISESTNYKNKALGIRGAEKIIQKLIKSIYPEKDTRLYILRHSRATHLAKHLTEAQMWTFFGWTAGSQVVRRYIHLSGRDIDSTLVSLAKTGNMENNLQEYKFKPKKCNRCFEEIAPGNKYCGKCALPVKLSEQYLKEKDLEIKNRNLKTRMESFERNMNEKITKLMLLIQQVPKLAYIKPDALLSKLESSSLTSEELRENV
jgi:integrase/recombinase XerD